VTIVLALAVGLLGVLVVALIVAEARRKPTPSRRNGIDDAIDLHTIQPRDIPKAVEAYLEAALEAGLSEVRLIHGKGKGVQRRRVQEILRDHPSVETFFDAPPARGAWGATIARLQSRRIPANGTES
jgi:dsDNA-specific endonuclease/ATPase MutS2